MATNRMSPLLHLHRAWAVREGVGPSDGQLLESYIATGDEAAFELLVRRHGPMVLGVCRRVLRDQHDAHDAFQATFLVLIRKAASVVPRDTVGNFLYGVARQTAVRARVAAAKRRSRERQVTDLPEPEARHTDPWDDVWPIFDQELKRLPEQYRAVVILCDLEGKTQKEAAGQLGWPEGTVASRLSRGRRLLAARLCRRGIAASGVGLAGLLSGQASANVPASLVCSTVRAASLTAGRAAGEISASVAVLTEGVMRGMMLKKLQTVAAMLLVAGTVVFGGGLLALHRATAGQPDAINPDAARPSTPASRPGEGRKEAGDRPKDRKARFEVRAEGKQVRVRAILGEEEWDILADRLLYDEDSRVFELEATGDEIVRARKRRGGTVEEIQCKRLVIDRKTETVQIRADSGVRGTGAGREYRVPVATTSVATTYTVPVAVNSVEYSVPVVNESSDSRARLGVLALGPVSVALDFGFPVRRNPQAQREEPLYTNGFVDSGTVVRDQREQPGTKTPGQPKPQPEEPAVAALKDRLAALNEAAAEKNFEVAEFYRRTGLADTACFYYEAVCRRYPDSRWAFRAKSCLAELKKQGGRVRE
jgi:RNA polymerase sigma factor (sigma-70 family)